MRFFTFAANNVGRGDIAIINQINDEINFVASSSRKANSNSFDGKPSGGNAIIWSKSLDFDIELKASSEHYLLSELTVNGNKFLLVNMYMPYGDRSTEIKGNYCQILRELEAAIVALNNSNILCVGDFNADPNRGRLWPLVDTFIRDNNLTVCDLILPINSFIYLSPAHNTTGWLDHIVTSKQINISNVEIMYDESIFDHCPLSFHLCLRSGVNILSRSRRKYLIENFVDRKSFNAERRTLYCDNILENMSGIEICTDVNCATDHTVHIDTVYDVLIKSFHISTKEFRINRSQKVKMIRGWNNNVQKNIGWPQKPF